MTEWTANPAVESLERPWEQNSTFCPESPSGQLPRSALDRLIPTIHCYSEETVYHSGTILSTHHYKVISLLGPLTNRPKKISKKTEEQRRQLMSLLACRLQATSCCGVLYKNSWKLTVKANRSWKREFTVRSHLWNHLVLLTASPLLTFPRDRKLNLVEVHQKHRKYWQGKNVIEVVRWKKKGIVIAVSAEKKKTFFNQATHNN